jgi:chromosome segregation ATPase
MVERATRQQRLWWQLFMVALVLAGGTVAAALVLGSGQSAPAVLRWAAGALALALLLGAWLLRSTQQAIAEEAAAGEALRQAIAVLQGKVGSAESTLAVSLESLPLPPSLQGLGASLERVLRQRDTQARQLHHLLQEAEGLRASLAAQHAASAAAREAFTAALATAEDEIQRMVANLRSAEGECAALTTTLKSSQSVAAEGAAYREALGHPAEALVAQGVGLGALFSQLRDGLGRLDQQLNQALDTLAEEAAELEGGAVVADACDQALEALPALQDSLALARETLAQRSAALAAQQAAFSEPLGALGEQQATLADRLTALGEPLEGLAAVLEETPKALATLAATLREAEKGAPAPVALGTFDAALAAAQATLKGFEKDLAPRSRSPEEA